MARFVTACIVLLAAASPAAAQTSGSYYHAVLKAGAAPHDVVSSEVVWHGHDNMLDAPEAGDVAKRVCAILAQRIGAIAQFSAGGKDMTADEMEYCNKHARPTKG